ncbi:hypothetical protein Tco_0452577 [Tanacetum coccineum]
MTLAASTSTNKSLKDFDELMNTPIDFSGYILNGLKMENLTQEVLLRPAFRLLKSTRSSYAKLEYDFEECYKDLLEKLDCENLEGGDYPFDLSKPLPLIQSRKRQRVPFEFFIDNDLKYAIKRRCIFYKMDSGSHSCLGNEETWLQINDIKDMLLLVVQTRLTNLLGDDVANFAIALRMFTRSLVIQKRVKDLQLGVKNYQKKINITKPDTTRPDLRKGTRTLYTKTLKDSFMSTTTRGTYITKNIDMEYLPKRRWSNLEKKRDHFMIKDINKLLKERRMMRSLEKFIGGRLYGTDLRLLQRTI